MFCLLNLYLVLGVGNICICYIFIGLYVCYNVCKNGCGKIGFWRVFMNCGGIYELCVNKLVFFFIFVYDWWMVYLKFYVLVVNEVFFVIYREFYKYNKNDNDNNSNSE